PLPTGAGGRVRSRKPRRPPHATPFPYTTLFRSEAVAAATAEPAAHWSVRLAALALPAEAADPGVQMRLLSEVEASLLRLVHERVDRKSTRLNSSHVKISYAVFCLKTKRKNRC